MNNKGMSLIQVMVAVGLTSVVTLGLSQMMVMSTKATKRTEVKMSSFVVLNELQTTISVEETCENAIAPGGVTQAYNHSDAEAGGSGLDISLTLPDGKLLAAGEQFDQNLDIGRLYLTDSVEQVTRPGVYKAKLMVEFEPRVALLGGNLKPQQAGTVLVTVVGGDMVSCAKEPEISKKVMCETLDGNYNDATEQCTALNHVSCGYVKEAKKTVDHNESYNTPYDSSTKICYKSGTCDAGKVYDKKETCYRHCTRERLKHGQSKRQCKSCSGRYTGGGCGRITCRNGSISSTVPACRHDPGGGGPSCFTAETKILMGDGVTELPISEVRIGDHVIGQDGALNEVVDIERVPLGRRELHSFNGSNHFITSEHPVKTTDGWKSFSPEATYYEHFIDVSDIPPGFNDEPLKFGDVLIRVDGKEELQRSLPPIKITNRSETVYNLRLEAAPESKISADDDRSHTYYANGYLVHNK